MTALNLEQARFNMVEQQIRTWDVLDPRVLDLLEGLPRDAFVEERYRQVAYADLNLPLEHGQQMMSPKLEGRILQALGAKSSEQVLEIGTGSGYLTACLASMSAHVTSVDIYPDFLERAQQRLSAHAIRNVTLTSGDAALGWKDGKRYDAIAVTGSLPELHEGFHHSLTIGGRLFLIVGDGPMMEGLLITRVAEDQWSTESLLDTHVPALINAVRKPRFDF
ncbi:MAG: protein-L-isoaspartate O-methyltransferase [Ectothiorhodospiraceae bacterium]|nr:protein-L-isoaspartate O-methyltransferase [Ectothiorhodospiraceae bacterium]MCH8503362.1 protein-L-isoaspartate O-methyltransferase [Ectothiorhodospiraceae bacterium]